MAQELDIAAAVYVQKELLNREIDKERRDRAFWISAFGGEVPEDLQDQLEPQIDVQVRSEDEVIAMSALGRG